MNHQFLCTILNAFYYVDILINHNIVVQLIHY